MVTKKRVNITLDIELFNFFKKNSDKKLSSFLNEKLEEFKKENQKK